MHRQRRKERINKPAITLTVPVDSAMRKERKVIINEKWFTDKEKSKESTTTMTLHYKCTCRKEQSGRGSTSI